MQVLIPRISWMVVLESVLSWTGSFLMLAKTLVWTITKYEVLHNNAINQSSLMLPRHAVLIARILCVVMLGQLPITQEPYSICRGCFQSDFIKRF